jgi:hypothetical protein
MHILNWAMAALALGLWTWIAWAAAWVLGLDPALIGGWSGRVGEWPGAAWLDLWLPGWDGLVVALVGLARELFAALGSIGPWLVWAAWGLGALLIVGTAALLSAAIGLTRRALKPATPNPPPTPFAGQV